VAHHPESVVLVWHHLLLAHLFSMQVVVVAAWRQALAVVL
jgi:hypothetical protein